MERYEPEHWFCYSLHCPMVLFHSIIEIFDLTNQYGYFPTGIDLSNSRFIGATFIHRDLFRNAIALHGFVKEAFSSGLIVLGR